MPTNQKNARISIILADDHGIVRAGIRQFLDEDPGLEVIGEAGNGIAALDLISLKAPDVAMVDIQMPGMNGIELTRMIREQGKQVRILILSAYDDIPFIQASIKAGADGYVIKTADPVEIIEAVYRVSKGEKVFSSGVRENLEKHLIIPGDLDKTLLTTREAEVLSLVSSGLSNSQIASRLGLSPRTVQKHLANIFQSLGTTSRTEAVMKAMAIGLITGPTGR